MSTLPSARAVVTFSLLFGSSGCLLSPYDLESFASQSSISMTGATLKAGGTVEIQACYHPNYFSHDCGTRFDTIATVTAASNILYVDHYNGLTYDWYGWTSTVSIPADYWAPTNGTPPPSATVRVLDPGGLFAFHYDNDPRQCPLPEGMAQLKSNNPLCGHATAANTGIVIFAEP